MQLKRIGPEGIGVVFVVVDSVDDEATSDGAVVDGIDVVVVVFTCVVDDGVEVVACPPLVVSVVGEEVDCVVVSAVVAGDVVVKFDSSVVLVVVGPDVVVDEETAVVSAAVLNLV